MLCCLLAILTMASAGFARWRRMISGLAALLLFSGASAALAWSWASHDSHESHGPVMGAVYCGSDPEGYVQSSDSR